MLAAKMPKDELLGAFRIALLMRIDEKYEAPQSVKDYFNSIVTQTKQILDKQYLPTTTLSPEAIDVAYIVWKKQILKSMHEMQDFDKTTSFYAKQLLSAIDSYAD